MNLNRFFDWKRAFFAAGVLLSSAGLASAFSYTNTDLLAGFRSSGGTYDLVVDLGPVATYEALPLRTVLIVTNLLPAQLTNSFPTLNNVNWSITGAMRGNANYPQYPLQTIWVSSPRPSVAVAGPVYNRKGQFTQGTIAGQIDAIGADGISYANSVPVGTNNTQTGIVIPSSDQNSYTTVMTTSGDLGGTFQFDVENITGANFTTTNIVSRSVVYKLLPASGALLNTPGTEIGYFDLRPDGSLTFTAGPAPEPTTITAISVTNTVATISFTTIGSVSYRLRFIGTAGLATPLNSWNTNGNVLRGNGAVQSLQDTNTGPVRFYSVESF